MDNQATHLLERARAAKVSYLQGRVPYETAHAEAKNYIIYANEKGKAIAKEHGMKFKPLSLAAFMR